MPIYRQRTYEAETLDQACDLAIADEGWDDNRSDVETSGDTYVTGAWEGRDAAFSGRRLAFPSRSASRSSARPAISRCCSVCSRYSSTLRRKAQWMSSFGADARDVAIAKAEAILAGENDPIEGAAS
ncbi:hypothetical protein BRDID11002_22550 [Bradyrhizobium diazoefficiens]